MRLQAWLEAELLRPAWQEPVRPPQVWLQVGSLRLAWRLVGSLRLAWLRVSLQALRQPWHQLSLALLSLPEPVVVLVVVQ